jgi:hypothetical protein
MKLLSSTDLAIARAITVGSLRVVEREGRFGAFWSIEDAIGVIEVALTSTEADERVGAIKAALQ